MWVQECDIMNYLEKVAMYENELIEKVAMNRASKLYRDGKLSWPSVDRLHKTDSSYSTMDYLADKARKIKTGQYGQKPATLSRYKKFITPSGMKNEDNGKYQTRSDILGIHRKAKFIGHANSVAMGYAKNQGILVFPTKHHSRRGGGNTNVSRSRIMKKIFDRNPNHQLSDDQYTAIKNRSFLPPFIRTELPSSKHDRRRNPDVSPLFLKMLRTSTAAHEISGETGAYAKGVRKLKGNVMCDDNAIFGTHHGLRPLNIQNKAVHILGDPVLKDIERDALRNTKISKETQYGGNQQGFMDAVYGQINKPRHKVSDKDMANVLSLRAHQLRQNAGPGKRAKGIARAESLAAGLSGDIDLNKGSEKYRVFLE